jgi:hypothetical protein
MWLRFDKTPDDKEEIVLLGKNGSVTAGTWCNAPEDVHIAVSEFMGGHVPFKGPAIFCGGGFFKPNDFEAWQPLPRD